MFKQNQNVWPDSLIKNNEGNSNSISYNIKAIYEYIKQVFNSYKDDTNEKHMEDKNIEETIEGNNNNKKQNMQKNDSISIITKKISKNSFESNRSNNTGDNPPVENNAHLNSTGIVNDFLNLFTTINTDKEKDKINSHMCKSNRFPFINTHSITRPSQNVSVSVKLPSMSKINEIFNNKITSHKSSQRSSQNSLFHHEKNTDSYSFKCKNMSQELMDHFDNEEKIHKPLIKFRIESKLKLPSSGVPEVHGLENSERILPAYYFTGKNLNGKLFEIDYLFTIEDDIHNMRPLNDRQLAFIDALDGEEKQKIIVMMNYMMKNITESFLATVD